MDEMIHHTKAVSRVVRNALVVADMPFGSYNVSIKKGVANANRMLKEGRADCIKLEGGKSMAPVVEAIVHAGIPVQGHIGLTPQTAGSLGGFKVQGKSLDAAKKVYDDAIALDEQGVFAVILEAIPRQLAEIITKKVKCVTVGIGGGVNCDGQVLVFHDLLGLFKRFTPKFVKVYANAYDFQLKAIQDYIGEVQQSKFPDDEHSFTMKPEIVDELRKYAGL